MLCTLYGQAMGNHMKPSGIHIVSSNLRLFDANLRNEAMKGCCASIDSDERIAFILDMGDSEYSLKTNKKNGILYIYVNIYSSPPRILIFGLPSFRHYTNKPSVMICESNKKYKMVEWFRFRLYVYRPYF